MQNSGGLSPAVRMGSSTSNPRAGTAVSSCPARIPDSMRLARSAGRGSDSIQPTGTSKWISRFSSLTTWTDRSELPPRA